MKHLINAILCLGLFSCVSRPIKNPVFQGYYSNREYGINACYLTFDSLNSSLIIEYEVDTIMYMKYKTLNDTLLIFNTDTLFVSVVTDYADYSFVIKDFLANKGKYKFYKERGKKERYSY